MSNTGSKLMIKPGHPLRGEYRLPGDKSLSHRAALLASMAQGESQVDHFLVAGVTQAMLTCLAELGVEWRLEGDRLWVNGKGLAGLRPSSQPLDCGNSATTLRLLAGALSAASLPAILDGSSGLRRRPMDRIVEPLHLMGVEISAQNGSAPVVLEGFAKPLHPLVYDLPVASAQVKSCILLAAMAADGITVLTEPGPSRDHTERMLAHLGINVETTRVNGEDKSRYITRLTPPNSHRLDPFNYTIPGDFSSAAFLIVAGLITPGSEIILPDVGLNPTRIGLLDALWDMGADITPSNVHLQQGEPVGDLTVRASSLHGTMVSGSQVVRMIDEFPALAVAASFANGTTLVSQAQELRLKESDRISQLCSELSTLGVNVSSLPDGFILQGGELPSGGSAQAHGDHRLAMSLALIGLAGRGSVSVHDADVIAESFPDFVHALQALGADMELTA